MEGCFALPRSILKSMISLLKNTTVKRAAALLTAAAMLLCACGCGDILSSDEQERETVLYIGDFEVPYEVFRYFVMNYKNDGVTDPDEIERLAKDAAASVYAVLALAKDYGIDADNDYINAVCDRAAQSAESECGGKTEYKESLAKSYMNDSVFRFMTRINELRDELYVRMAEEGDIDTSDERMKEIAESDEFICVKQILILGETSSRTQDGTIVSPAAKHTEKEAAALAKEARERATGGEDFDALVAEYGESLFMFSNTDGYYICRGMWEAENEDAVFALDIGEVSEVVHSSSGYSVFKRCEKSSEFIEKNIDSISTDYYGAVLARAVDGKSAEMDIREADAYADINVADMK